jgi:mono/diheme cytochrome c family protein
MTDTTTPSTALAKLSKFRQLLVGLAPVALLTGWLTGGTTFHQRAKPNWFTPDTNVYQYAKPKDAPPAAAPNGHALFVQHCASCHGEKGEANGIAGLKPKARYFGRDKYKFTSTRKGDLGGIPTDDDIVYILQHGINGSAMPSFHDKLSEVEMRAVVGHLRVLTRAGLAKRFALEAEKNEEDPDWKAMPRWASRSRFRR